DSLKDPHEIAPSRFRACTCLGGPIVRMAVFLIQTREHASGSRSSLERPAARHSPVMDDKIIEVQEDAACRLFTCRSVLQLFGCSTDARSTGAHKRLSRHWP